MTLTEMSNEFDILYNNIMSNQAPGLDEYEKSLFLTKAQNELILEYFNPKGNKFQEGFDGSERRQIDFSSLVFTKTVDDPTTSYAAKRDNRSIVFSLQENTTPILLIINEFLRLHRDAVEAVPNVSPAIAADDKILTVVPISYIEYARVMMKPYKLPVKSQAWRLLNSTADTTNSNTAVPYAEILYNDSAYENYDPSYVVTYVKRPDPIILINLADAYSDVSIDNKTTATPCELDPIMHHDIVQRAVELAKAAYTGDLSTQIQVGNASATNLGIVSSNSGRER